jgi:hypothetical protein
MIREIFTLRVDNISTQYYIRFEKDRKRFFFQASLKNNTAPSFTVFVHKDELVIDPHVDDFIAEQALHKVREIVADKIFDRL